MKVLAERLEGVITLVVGPHQTCGIKGRTLVINVHVARSILECCDDFQQKVTLLQVDLEKAFDRVSHEILFFHLRICSFRFGAVRWGTHGLP